MDGAPAFTSAARPPVLTLSSPTDLTIGDWETVGSDPNLLRRELHYTKPVSGPGPREVYCQGAIVSTALRVQLTKAASYPQTPKSTYTVIMMTTY